MSWWRLVNLEYIYIYQSWTIDGCFKTPARLAISFLTQIRVCVPKKPQIWGRSCHSWSSIIQLLLVGYFEPYLSQRSWIKTCMCFNKRCVSIWGIHYILPALCIVSMLYPADLDLSHDLFILISGWKCWVHEESGEMLNHWRWFESRARQFVSREAEEAPSKSSNETWQMNQDIGGLGLRKFDYTFDICMRFAARQYIHI